MCLLTKVDNQWVQGNPSEPIVARSCQFLAFFLDLIPHQVVQKKQKVSVVMRSRALLIRNVQEVVQASAAA